MKHLPKSLFDANIKRYFAPIMPLMEDVSVSEIMINGPSDVWAERKGMLEETDCQFDDEDALMTGLRHISQYLGRPLSSEHPILEPMSR